MEKWIMRGRHLLLLLLLLQLTMVAITCSGCNYKKNFNNSESDYGSARADDPKLDGPRLFGSLNGNPAQHDNTYVEYSAAISNRLAKVNGIGVALVMLTDKNAYVGIVINNTATGTLKKGGRETIERDNSGWVEGVYNSETGSPYYNNRKMLTPYNTYITIKDHNLISDEFKQTIAKHVREQAPAVEEVHISANRDFVNELVLYAREAWLNHSMEPLVQPFNTLVQYEFGNQNQNQNQNQNKNQDLNQNQNQNQDLNQNQDHLTNQPRSLELERE